jgi:DNA-binding XRE family transcriptional regulator
MSAQILAVKGKPALVVLPIAEYERLRAMAEDAADIAAYDQGLASIREGDAESFSPEFVARLLGGESKLKVWREHRGLASATLARRCAVTPAALSMIESGKRVPSLALARKLARALGCDLDDLV